MANTGGTLCARRVVHARRASTVERKVPVLLLQRSGRRRFGAWASMPTARMRTSQLQRVVRWSVSSRSFPGLYLQSVVAVRKWANLAPSSLQYTRQERADVVVLPFQPHRTGEVEALGFCVIQQAQGWAVWHWASTQSSSPTTTFFFCATALLAPALEAPA